MSDEKWSERAIFERAIAAIARRGPPWPAGFGDMLRAHAQVCRRFGSLEEARRLEWRADEVERVGGSA